MNAITFSQQKVCIYECNHSKYCMYECNHIQSIECVEIQNNVKIFVSKAGKFLNLKSRAVRDVFLILRL